MQKSIAKKVKLKKGKVYRRPMAIGHNRTRKTSKLIRSKRKSIGLIGINIKLLKNYLRAK